MNACVNCRFRKQRDTFGMHSICTHPATRETRPLLDLVKLQFRYDGSNVRQVAESARELIGVDGPWKHKRVWRWPWSFDPWLTKTCRGYY